MGFLHRPGLDGEVVRGDRDCMCLWSRAGGCLADPGSISVSRRLASLQLIARLPLTRHVQAALTWHAKTCCSVHHFCLFPLVIVRISHNVVQRAAPREPRAVIDVDAGRLRAGHAVSDEQREDAQEEFLAAKAKLGLLGSQFVYSASQHWGASHDGRDQNRHRYSPRE